MKINGKRVPDDRFEQEWQRLHQARRQDPQLQRLGDDELRRLTRENVIGQVLLEQEAIRRFPEVPARDITQEYKQIIARYGNEKEFLKANRLTREDVGRVKQDLKRRLQINRLLDQLFATVSEPTEKEVFDEYMRNPGAFSTPEQVHASHIVKHTNQGQDPEAALAAITEVKKALDEGGDFDKLAGEHSDCASGAQDLGFFPRGQMVEAFEDVVFKMAPGHVSEVFKTEFGYHIAKVHELRPAKVTPFAEVREQLTQYLSRQRHNQVVDTFVEKLRQQVKIDD